jgi:hypothetical protein
MARTSAEMRQWALVGARARIQELSAEIERIRAMFPGEFGLPAGAKRGATTGKPKKRKLSAAGRKAISDAAKARWARQKTENSAVGPAAPKAGKRR